MPFLSNPSEDARDSGFHATPAAFIDAGPRHLLQVIGYSENGTYGAKLQIYIRTDYDLTAQRPFIFTIMFGHGKCGGALTKLEHSGHGFVYTVAAEIPHFSTTGWLRSPVPLCLSMEDEDGQHLGVVEVGDFTYLDGPTYEPYVASADVSRKRRISSESAEYVRPPAKRPSSQQLLEKSTEDQGSYETPSSTTQALPYAQMNVPYEYASPTYGRSAGQQQANPRRTQQLPYQYPPPPTLAGKNINIQSPVTSSYSPYSPVSQPSRSPLLAAAPLISREETTPATASGAQPILIRTSTLQPSPIAATASAQSFNPYAIYPNSKAILKIEGDLGAVTQGWTNDEISTKRRLVQFQRRQSGSVITTTFEAVAPQDRTPNSICVSCILWGEKGEYFITSVDTIYLLESLVAVRFTVEEKNRIRRNLEGFHPLTVSKTKREYESFFKVIMGFPSPKPRNIEKDVKVFPWKILAHALKKIISKYVSMHELFPSYITDKQQSASYSSTASALPAATAGPSSSSAEYQPTTSPRSNSSPERSNAYWSETNSTDVSPSLKASAGPRRSAGPPDARKPSISELASASSTTSPWQPRPYPAHHDQHNIRGYPSGYPIAGAAAAAAAGAAGRTPWDLAAYLDPGPASAATTATHHHQQPQQPQRPQHPLHYPRDQLTSVPGQMGYSHQQRPPSQSQQPPYGGQRTPTSRSGG